MSFHYLEKSLDKLLPNSNKLPPRLREAILGQKALLICDKPIS